MKTVQFVRWKHIISMGGESKLTQWSYRWEGPKKKVAEQISSWQLVLMLQHYVEYP
jgi:hypothetical protein